MPNDPQFDTSPGERAAWANGFEAGQAATEPLEPYLILHKVRGQPAFDIAIKMQIGDEEGWIIPTSGHRAYPVWTERLDHIDFLVGAHPDALIAEHFQEHSTDVPDHYSCNTPHDPSPRPSLVNSLLERLGLVQKINRRI